jgi:signal transduction histidine kinase
MQPESRGARSAYDVVERGLDTLAIVWQALWCLGEQQLWPTHQPSSAATIAVTVGCLSWVFLLTVRVFAVTRLQQWARLANVAALSVAAGALLSAAAGSTPPSWGAASSLAVLSTSLAGLLFGTRLAALWVGVVVSVEAAVVLGVLESGGEVTGIPTDILYPLYALSLGVVTISARGVLTRDARRTDLAAADLVRAERDRLTAEGVEQTMHREERLLHETVLNTLAAIIRGGLTATDALHSRLKERCRESAEVLRQLGRSEPGLLDLSSQGHRLDRDLQAFLVELYATGASVHVDCDPLDGLPVPVYAAIRAAAREALVNVVRHANAEQVWFIARSVTAGFATGARVEVRDDGRGFDSGADSKRYGIRGVIVDGVREVGGTAVVASAPDSGTRIIIEWLPDVARGPVASYLPASSAFAIPVVLSFGLFTTLVVVLTRGDIVQPGLALLAFALLVSISGFIAWLSVRGPLAWWAVLALAGTAPLIYQLQTQAVSSPHGPWTDWSSAAIVALFVVAAAAGPGWAWLLLLVTWLFIQGDIVHELLAAGTAMLASAALFGRSTRRNADKVERVRSQEMAEVAARSVAEEGVSGIRRRYGALAESDAVELLDGIADGLLDPDDDATRSTAAMEEGFIRTVMRVDPALDGVHALASALAVEARRRGVFLAVDLTTACSPAQFPTVAGKQSLSWAIDSSRPGGVARLSARAEGPDYVIRLIAPIMGQHRDQTRALPVPGVVLDPSDPDMLWELRQALGGLQ